MSTVVLYETLKETELELEKAQRKIRGLETEIQVLNKNIKSKQIMLDIKSREAEKLKRALDLFVDTTALATMIMEGECV